MIFLDRTRVVRRHLNSLLVGEFFRAIYPPERHVGAMNAFGNMGAFCGVRRTERWTRDHTARPAVSQAERFTLDQTDAPPWWNPALPADGLESQFISYLCWIRDWGEDTLRPIIERLMRETGLEGVVDDWQGLLNETLAAFQTAIAAWRFDYDNLFWTWCETEDDHRAQLNAINYQLGMHYEVTVIEALADRQFLPHYGFPIGVHKLRVIAPDASRPGRVREEDQYRLERGSLLAIREYVPGSQLLVGGKLVTSHGLLKHWTGANLDTALGLRGRYARCVNDHLYYWRSATVAACPICGGEAGQSERDLLFPRHGFSGAAWDPPKWSTDVERVGRVETATMAFTPAPQDESEARFDDNLGGVAGLGATYRDGGELLVYNEGDNERGFAICLSCGYADSERKLGDGAIDLPTGFDRHAPLEDPTGFRRCWRDGEAPVVRNQTLAARETTDVLLVDIAGAIGEQRADERIATTLAYALQRAGAQMLELDSREIGTMVAPAGPNGRGFGAIVYDSTPGGAGHVRELMVFGRAWLEAARDVLFVSEDHDRRCQTACLDCLLSFDAQFAAQRRLLDRPEALAILNELLGPDDARGGSAPSGEIASLQNDDPVVALPPLTASERLYRARARQTQRRS